jgi:hypothetical protein
MLASAAALFPVPLALAAALLAAALPLLLGAGIPRGAKGAAIVVVGRHGEDCDTS